MSSTSRCGIRSASSAGSSRSTTRSCSPPPASPRRCSPATRVVLKPSEQTSLSALRLGELARPVLPPGVLNVVTGTGDVVGERLVAHPDVPRIAFTGSEAVGRRILARAAATAIKTVTLELGGKNPLIVFPDADLPAAVDGALRGMNFRWQGQSCGSTSRLFVHRSVYARFIADLAARMASLTDRRPAARDHRRGTAGVQGPLRPGPPFPRAGPGRSALELVTGGTADRTARVLRPADPVQPRRRPARPAVHRGDLRAGPGRRAVRRLRPGHRAGQRLRVGLTASVWTTSLHTAHGRVA